MQKKNVKCQLLIVNCALKRHFPRNLSKRYFEPLAPIVIICLKRDPRLSLENKEPYSSLCPSPIITLQVEINNTL
ncbi:MAG: hypothetical protein ACD_57C00141G0005 [uncultured bacterium]|nr:MAG: hypothetical protein ACD_57C00141G0005 [uncultured bacterium]